MSLKSHDEGPDENMEEEEEEEVVSMSEEDLLKELDKQEPAFQVCSRLFKSPNERTPFKILSLAKAAELKETGFFVMDDFMSLDSAISLRAATEELFQEGKLQSARKLGIEHTSHLADPNARGDYILWLHEGKLPASNQPFCDLLSMFKELHADLENIMHLQPTKSEYQLGYYPPDGSQYVRHRDAIPDDGSGEMNQRKLTAIIYANPGWAKDDGGRLRLWLPQTHSAQSSNSSCNSLQPTGSYQHSDSFIQEEKAGQEARDCRAPVGGHPDIVDIAPLAGRLVVFLSGAIEHAVLPAVSNRVALTCWLH